MTGRGGLAGHFPGGFHFSLSHGIIERHGGRIHIVSTPKAGATFVIELPLVAPESLDGESE